MQLSDRDRSRLSGEEGRGVQLAMELLVKAATAQGAPEFIDITTAHVDSCLYHGQAGLDFAQELAQSGTEVAVPSTLNVSSLDLLHPDLYRGSAESARSARALMDAYVEMGCLPTWTCSPYQLADRPAFGEQIAWAESNAIVFANSVLGARTERYGDFYDICCALTGRAPNIGLHTNEGRRATLVVELDVADAQLDDDLLYPLLGHSVGSLSGTAVPVIVGLDHRATEDRLKALGAAAASAGAVAMFHAVGVTPEAPTLAAATQGREPESRLTIDVERLNRSLRALDRGSGALGAVSVGTPHFSVSEFAQLARLVDGRRTLVPFYVNIGHDVLEEVERRGLLAGIVDDFGATIVTDTCTYVTPIIDGVDGVVMTNSGKWAYYAPGNIGVEVAFGSLSDCVASASAGELVGRTGLT